MVYKPAELERRIARYLALVRRHIGIDKAILFGSYAYGQPHEFSDVDVVIVSRDFCDVPYIHRLEQLSLLAWESKAGDIEALGYTPEEFEQARDLSLLGEVRERGIVVYDAAPGGGLSGLTMLDYPQSELLKAPSEQKSASLTADCHPPRAQGERLHIRMLRP